jgi:molybdate transport system ATP-binding protein
MNAPAQRASAPAWDIALRRTLRHLDARFELDLRFRSDATRIALHDPSGVGKTQALRLIAGVATPDDGHVRMAGRTLYDHAAGIDLPPRQRRLACVFQDYALFPHLTVRQNIAFPRRRGWLNPARGAVDEQVEHWIRTFQLEAAAGQYPHQLSGGQRQRTALARALVAEPTALLLDEPFAALDRALRRQLRSELAELQAAVGLPMLIITHDEDDVRALADDIVHVEAGRAVSHEASFTPD